jgi:hypothetical protein
VPVLRESVTLQFATEKLLIGEDTDIRNQLSAVAADGQHLWLACDEGCRLERLSRAGATSTFGAHEVSELDTLLDLPAPATEEADVEGMYVDDGWLWLVGSHSVKRKKPKGKSPVEVAGKLLETPRDGNRHLLARIPTADGQLHKTSGTRRAGALRATQISSALLEAARADAHLRPFIDIPGKDNGFDIEGLAARGLRVWVGLRGPVLREWCCVLELQLESSGDELRLVEGGEGAIRKHFFKLDGLGVRDLVLLGDDLLILAGPTMAHDGPNGVWRWKNGAKPGAAVDQGNVKQVLTLPQGIQSDKPEGIAVLDDAGAGTSLLVVFDTPSDTRKVPPSGVRADVYQL